MSGPWYTLKGTTRTSVLDTGTGVILWSAECMVFVPGVMLVGNEIVTKEGLAPSDVPGCSMHDRAAGLQRQVDEMSRLHGADIKMWVDKTQEAERQAQKWQSSDAAKDYQLAALNVEIEQLKAELARGGLSVSEEPKKGFLSLFKG